MPSEMVEIMTVLIKSNLQSILHYKIMKYFAQLAQKEGLFFFKQEELT
jgi:competence protein ComGF